jgi:hypothetical protein
MFLWRPRQGRRLGEGLGELAAGMGGIDLLVDDADLDGAVDAAAIRSCSAANSSCSASRS